MPDPSTSLRATHGGLDMAALLRPIFTPQIPYSEWAGRTRYGAALDTARIDGALRAADVGIMWPLADMAREALAHNPKAQGILGKALLPLGGADWDLTPAETGLSQQEQEQAKTIATAIRGKLMAIPNFEQALFDLAFGFFDGRAALEKQVVRRPTGTGFVHEISSLDWIPPQTLSFEQARRLIYVIRWGDYGMFTRRGPVLDEVPGKFSCFTPRMFGDLQEREGLAPRYLFWLLFDRINWRQRFIVAERFGIPWLFIENEIMQELAGIKLGLPQRQDGGEGGAPGDDTMAFDYAVTEAQNLQQDGTWHGLPGQKLKPYYPPDSVREFFSQGSDQIMDRLSWLTNHNGVDGTNRAEEVVKRLPEEQLLDFRGRRVSGVVQGSIVNVLLELDYGADALPLAPKFQLRTQPPRDRDKEVGRIKTLIVDLGLRVGEGAVYEASGIRPPNPGEAIVTPPAPASPFGSSGESGGTSGSAPTKPGSAPATPRDDSGGQDNAGAMRDLIESADEEDQRDAADEDAVAKMSRWFASTATGRKVQPSSANGSPEPLVERGVREGTRSTSSWAAELADAADGTSAASIYRNLQRCANGLDVEAFTRALERRLVHGAMLGGLDANYEMHNDVVLVPAHFVAAPIVVPGVPAASGVADFSTMPFGEAIRAFAGKQVIPRRVFDRLSAAAKKKAFTVAGLARKDMLATAHDELHKALTDGDDLRAFSKRLSERFDAAGWTRLNPSHVENVFRTNIMGAYSAGRREQMDQPAVLAARPYRQILGVDDARTRPTHHDALTKVLDAKDPFWDRAGPPFGFQCRCRAVSRSAADLKRLGLVPTIGAQIRGLPDEGWDAGGSLL